MNIEVAVIPAAGRGTRMRPATRVSPAEWRALFADFKPFYDALRAVDRILLRAP